MDLLGEKFGRLRVLEAVGHTKYRNIIWECICDCGKYTKVAGGNLTSGHTKSCGCLSQETKARIDNKSIKHAHVTNYRRSPTYQSWRCMRERCLYKSNASYPHYGGRGITVCDRWNVFTNFLEDMGPRPAGEYHIDRIDPHGNYRKENCRWQHNSKMAENRRRPSGIKKSA